MNAKHRETDDRVHVWVRMTFADTMFREYMTGAYDAELDRVVSFKRDWEIEPVEGDDGLAGVDKLFALSSFTIGPLEYFTDMIGFLKKLGYEPGRTLFGFPYDWRQGSRTELLRALVFVL